MLLLLKVFLVPVLIAVVTLIALLSLAVTFAFGMAVFGIRIEGSWLGFVGVAVATAYALAGDVHDLPALRTVGAALAESALDGQSR